MRSNKKFEGMNDMIHLLRLEIMKFKRSKFPFVLLSLVLIILGSYFFFIDKKEMSIERVKEIVQSNYDMNKTGYEETKAKIEATEGRISDQLQREFTMYERLYNSSLIMYKGINDENWSLYLQGEIIDNQDYEKEKILK